MFWASAVLTCSRIPERVRTGGVSLLMAILVSHIIFLTNRLKSQEWPRNVRFSPAEGPSVTAQITTHSAQFCREAHWQAVSSCHCIWLTNTLPTRHAFLKTSECNWWYKSDLKYKYLYFTNILATNNNSQHHRTMFIVVLPISRPLQYSRESICGCRGLYVVLIVVLIATNICHSSTNPH